MEIYLDNAATTKVFPSIKEKLPIWLDDFFANPNSLYPPAQKAKQEIEKARLYLSEILNVQPENIVFTSGATESNNTILKGFMEKTDRKEILISPIEHKSVLNPAKYLAKKGYKITYLKVNKNGLIDLEDLKQKLSKNVALAAVIYANNETGVIQDVKSIKKLLNEFDVPLFSDTAQAVFKTEVPFEYMDFFCGSGHKFNALRGIGFFVKKRDIEPLIHGGGQEEGFRSGTQNTAGILSIHEAGRIWTENQKEYHTHLKNLQSIFEKNLKEKIPEIKIVSENVERLPNISLVIFPKVDAQSMVVALGQRGIYVSSGSACSSGTPTPSHVLLSYGYSPEEALRAVRFSFGVENTEEEILQAVDTVVDIFKTLYEFV